MPANGARIVARSSERRATTCRALASASDASACETASESASTTRVETAPASASRLSRSRFRCCSRRSFWRLRTSASVKVACSRAVCGSICASTWPCFTACPGSAKTWSTEPPSSARTRASRSAPSEPEIAGPSTRVVSATTVMFSGPMTTGASVSLASAAFCARHAVRATPAAAAMTRITDALRTFIGLFLAIAMNEVISFFSVPCSSRRR